MDGSGTGRALSRRRLSPALRFIAVCMAAVGVLLLLGAAPVLRQPLVLVAHVEKVGVCDGQVEIDALAHDADAHHCMRFRVWGVLKGDYEEATLGLLLHSPTVTFWGRGQVGTVHLLGLEPAPNVLWLREVL